MNFERYLPAWQQQVGALADQVLGDGYFARPSEIAREENTVMLIAVEGEDQLLGFAYGRVLPADGLRDFVGGAIDELPAELADADNAGTLGVIQTIAVSEKARGNRTGTKLLRNLHDTLIGWGADKLIATFKRGPGSTNVDGIMNRLGFAPWMQRESYWRAECDAGEFKCVFRTDRCICQALFYRKQVY